MRPENALTTRDVRSLRQYVRHVAAAALAALLALFLAPPADASPKESRFPLQTVTVLVPFAAGGAFDILARSVAQSMASDLPQPVIVENVSGAGGTIGATRIARAQPDGYNLLMGSLGPNSAAPALYKNLQYDPRKDFAPIALVSKTPMVLVVRNGLPAKSLNELIELSKKTKLAVGSAGVGSISHVALLLWNQQTKMDVVHVPYRSLPLSMNDLLGDRIDMMFDQIVTSAPHIKAGKVRALAVTSPQRSSMLPDVPTTAELGFPSVNVVAWTALFAPKDTPQPIVTLLNKSISKALDDPKVRESFATLGADIPPPAERTPATLARLVDSEVAKWTPLLKSVEASE